MVRFTLALIGVARHGLNETELHKVSPHAAMARQAVRSPRGAQCLEAALGLGAAGKPFPMLDFHALVPRAAPLPLWSRLRARLAARRCCGWSPTWSTSAACAPSDTSTCARQWPPSTSQTTGTSTSKPRARALPPAGRHAARTCAHSHSILVSHFEREAVSQRRAEELPFHLHAIVQASNVLVAPGAGTPAPSPMPSPRHNRHRSVCVNHKGEEITHEIDRLVRCLRWAQRRPLHATSCTHSAAQQPGHVCAAEAGAPQVGPAQVLAAPGEAGRVRPHGRVHVRACTAPCPARTASELTRAQRAAARSRNTRKRRRHRWSTPPSARTSRPSSSTPTDTRQQRSRSRGAVAVH
jgi:hypothetical protein